MYSIRISNGIGHFSITLKHIGLICIAIVIILISKSLSRSSGFSFLFLFLFTANYIILVIPESHEEKSNLDTDIIVASTINFIVFAIVINAILYFGFSEITPIDIGSIVLAIGVVVLPVAIIFDVIIYKIVFHRDNNNNGSNLFYNIIIILYSILLAIELYSMYNRSIFEKLFATLLVIFYVFNITYAFGQRQKNISNKQNKTNKNDILFRKRNEEKTLYYSLGISAFLFIVLFNISPYLLLFLIIITVAMIKAKQGQLLGQAVRVSSSQFPEVYKIAVLAANRLKMTPPDIFIIQSPVINAYALGFLGKKCVVLHSKTVSSMSNEELLSIIGHEFTHVKYSHTNWIAITSSMKNIKIPIVTDIMKFIFLFWSRIAEYTADRGGLLASKDLSASISALSKIAIGEELFMNLNINEFAKQEQHVENDLISRLSMNLSTHPYIVRRIKALQEFFFSDKYNRLDKLSESEYLKN